VPEDRARHDPFAPVRPLPNLPPAEPLDGRRPRILAHVLRAIPQHNAGAESMLHAILEGLVERGWDAQIVAVEHRGEPYTRHGIPVCALSDAQMRGPFAWCDVALTHLDVTPMAMAWARYGRPLIHLVHNHKQLEHHSVPDNGRHFPIWNSEWVAELWSTWQSAQIVCRPPVRAADHATRVPHRRKLHTATLVNLLDQKGGPLFWRLARRMPEWSFLGVEGAYGFQVVPQPMPANGELQRQQEGLTAVWERTSVYLAPSWYESWGMAAVEALASGIPVIAHPTPGLRESLGDAAIFVDRDDDQGWVDALHRLDDPREYARWSDSALRRSVLLDQQSTDDLDRLAAWALELAKAYRGDLTP
jgi:hypothetical protein